MAGVSVSSCIAKDTVKINKWNGHDQRAISRASLGSPVQEPNHHWQGMGTTAACGEIEALV